MSASPSLSEPTRHITASGVRVYTVTVSAFAQLRVNVFLILAGPPERPTYSALIDTGSSEHLSHEQLLAGLEQVRTVFGENWTWETLSRIVITHPHPDHAGGLPFVRGLSAAPLAAHALAVPTLEHPEQRRKAQQERIEADLLWAGLLAEGADPAFTERMRRRAGNLMLPSGVTVQDAVQDGDLLDGLFQVIHTPGHEGSQICLRLDNLLLSADHLLPRNSPPLMPEHWLPGGGLTHYLKSLDKVAALQGVDLALGSHDDPMTRWQERIQALRDRYADKLAGMLEAAGTPQSIYELTLAVNPRLRSFQALLLIDQTGALAEYLVRQGRMRETVGDTGQALFERV